MDQPAHTSPVRPGPPLTAGQPAVDPDALPPGPARRAQLLFILIILPVVAVTLPAILVTLIFGQRPKGKDTAPPDMGGLHHALQLSATALLPTPSTLTGEPIRLTCRPERLAARADRVRAQAATFGGTANEWMASEGERHFYVELPAGRGESFRLSLAGDGPAAPPPSPAPAAPAATGAKDQVEVFIRANSDE